MNNSSIIYQIKNMKKVLSFILVFLLIFSFLPLKISDSQDYKFLAEINFNVGESSFYINGYKLNFDSNENIVPIIKNGRTFIPVRSIIESIGGEVFWKEKTREVEIKFNNNLIALTIDKNSAFVNEKSKKIDNDDEIKPFILYSRTYVPLRFIIENLDGNIEYNSKDKSIGIKIDRETKEVTDSTGRKVIVPKKIYRIVSLYPMSTIMIFALKSQDRFIGTYSSSMKVINFENIKKISPDFEKLPDLGTFKDYNPEVLLSCKPDIIVTPHYTNIKKLEEINLPVLLLDHELPENLLKSINILGDAIDKKEEAEKIINYYNKNKKLVEDKLKGLEKRK
ncbi:MAG TPA: stalk domain-containing protein, partial [Caldisericia bacterium]|nr:stalk domain-containing protein [Caldisericia bacterium]